MSSTQFREQIAELSAQLAGRPLDAQMDAWLNAEHGATSTSYAQLKQSCITGLEIDLIMPLDEGAQFDGRPAGWLVCPPGSAHRPTVTGGRALVLYLLPEGSITFTR